jgi:hypothetical protein
MVETVHAIMTMVGTAEAGISWADFVPIIDEGWRRRYDTT